MRKPLKFVLTALTALVVAAVGCGYVLDAQRGAPSPTGPKPVLAAPDSIEWP